MRIRVAVSASSLAQTLATFLMGAGLLGVAVCALAWFDVALYQFEENRRFERQLAREPDRTAPRMEATEAVEEAGSEPPDPRILGRLEIPSLDLQVLVRDGVDEASLRKAVGHLPGSAAPGGAGNFVVLGHRDTFFRPLRDIALDDLIRVRTRLGVFEYRVDTVVVTEPDGALALTQTGGPTVTLITCYPFYFAGTAPRRFVVRGRLAGPPISALPMQRNRQEVTP